MTKRKTTAVEAELSALTDTILRQVDEIGQKHGYSHKFWMNVRYELGGDFADIYSEWDESRQSGGVPT